MRQIMSESKFIDRATKIGDHYGLQQESFKAAWGFLTKLVQSLLREDRSGL